jgi:hypothetical protein
VKSKSGRLFHPCNHCENSHAKCTGKTSCIRCKVSGIECQYGDSKREARGESETDIELESADISSGSRPRALEMSYPGTWTWVSISNRFHGFADQCQHICYSVNSNIGYPAFCPNYNCGHQQCIQCKWLEA